ncbi:hypothetical protein MSAN_01468600 [Mycena sanguinolenta]|uniref:Pyridine nucleotide-disulphide oxidoreductase N-terminal domain-containing protein n=1 Tax=Mycena sanguinolenta TaxID=230812 RepID=A0A8H6YB61_9AGAR|nr:hypothetical protein MSAN_01468600 [Mycena sanguinolenta]
MTTAANTLPTLDRLGVTVTDSDLDHKKIVAEWFSLFGSAVEKGNVDNITALFADGALWRDILSLTWDFRTFQGSAIQQFLVDRLAEVQMSNLKLKDEYQRLLRPYPDIVWIEAMFTFETRIGLGSGVFRLIPQKEGAWKAHCMFTNLEDLKGFPEKLGPLRDHAPNHGKWDSDRQRSVAFEEKDPTVLIVGGGQSGLELASRLKCLDVSTLVVEKKSPSRRQLEEQIRSSVPARSCLYISFDYDPTHLANISSTWPVYTPAKKARILDGYEISNLIISSKLANWLEYYAEALEVPVWTSSEVTAASLDPSGMWKVTVSNSQGASRIFTVKHLVFATGFGSYRGKLPTYPGMDEFKGQILHSSQHKKATDHAGKKVVVIGACTSGIYNHSSRVGILTDDHETAHDICADYYEHGVDVTMFQRSSTYIMTTRNGFRILFKDLYEEDGPPVDVADRINASYPIRLTEFLAQRRTLEIAEADKELLDALRNRGFRLNLGFKDAGFSLAVWENAGGYYLDVGTSKLIADGKIKLKNDSLIQRFTPTGLKFENGSELPADVIVFATGVGDVRDNIRKVCGDTLTDKCKVIWGLDEEGEINGCWRDLGIPGLWYMMGNLAYCRFHSKHVALQIKAMEEGIFSKRYSLK